MAINYIEKGHRLHLAIGEAGHSLSQIDGVWISSDDVAVQAIIDAFDALPEAQADARERVKIEATKRTAELYPFINPEKDEALGLYQFTADLLTHLNATSGLTGNLLAFQTIRNTAQTKIAEINALTDWQQADSYDATIGW